MELEEGALDRGRRREQSMVHVRGVVARSVSKEFIVRRGAEAVVSHRGAREEAGRLKSKLCLDCGLSRRALDCGLDKGSKKYN